MVLLFSISGLIVLLVSAEVNRLSPFRDFQHNQKKSDLFKGCSRAERLCPDFSKGFEDSVLFLWKKALKIKALNPFDL